MTITLYENFRAIFYSPFYLVHALGAFEAEGVDVAMSLAPVQPQVGADVIAGRVDVAWGGPMRVMVHHDQAPDCGLVSFCEAVRRDPFILVGRTPKPDFTVADLTKVRLGSVSEVPTPWMCLQEDVRQAGIDPATLTRVGDRTMPENVAALRAGDLDVVQLFQPYAEELLADGTGHLWYAQATRGLCSYTTYNALQQTIETKGDALYRMTRAMYRTQKWLAAADTSTVVEALRPFFADLPLEILTASVQRYRDLGIWSTDPVMQPQGFTRLRRSLLTGGLIKYAPDYDGAVDMRFAHQVVREDPPSM